jgi:hypothetical protein
VLVCVYQKSKSDSEIYVQFKGLKMSNFEKHIFEWHIFGKAGIIWFQDVL